MPRQAWAVAFAFLAALGVACLPEAGAVSAPATVLEAPVFVAACGQGALASWEGPVEFAGILSVRVDPGCLEEGRSGQTPWLTLEAPAIVFREGSRLALEGGRHSMDRTCANEAVCIGGDGTPGAALRLVAGSVVWSDTLVQLGNGGDGASAFGTAVSRAVLGGEGGNSSLLWVEARTVVGTPLLSGGVGGRGGDAVHEVARLDNGNGTDAQEEGADGVDYVDPDGQAAAAGGGAATDGGRRGGHAIAIGGDGGLGALVGGNGGDALAVAGSGARGDNAEAVPDLRPMRGGDGGNASATGGNGGEGLQQGGRGGNATAYAGPGGRGGDALYDATGPVKAGHGGRSGAAEAQGGDGGPSRGAGGDGGLASAYASSGGDGGDALSRKGSGGDGGDVGPIVARGGDGGSGINGPGGDGGPAQAICIGAGGHGGFGTLRGGRGGEGEPTFAFGGNGGAGVPGGKGAPASSVGCAGGGIGGWSEQESERRLPAYGLLVAVLALLFATRRTLSQG